MQGIDRLVLRDNKVLQELTHFLMLQKGRFERRIIGKHENIHCSQRSPCRTTGPNHAGFFGYLDAKGLEHTKT